MVLRTSWGERARAVRRPGFKRGRAAHPRRTGVPHRTFFPLTCREPDFPGWRRRKAREPPVGRTLEASAGPFTPGCGRPLLPCLEVRCYRQRPPPIEAALAVNWRWRWRSATRWKTCACAHNNPSTALSRQSRNQNDLRILRKSRKTLLRLCPACPVSRLHRPPFPARRDTLQPLGHPFCPGPHLPSPLPSGPMGVAAQHHPNPMNTMLSFLARFAALVRGGILEAASDRLFFCGSLPVSFGPIAAGLAALPLGNTAIPYKDFAAHSLEVTARLGGGLPPTGPATRSRDPGYLQLRPTPQGRHRSGDRRPRPHQGKA